jgi:hypothetical protein
MKKLLLGLLFLAELTATAGVDISNQFKLGDGTASDKTFVGNTNAAASAKPRLKYSNSAARWQVCHVGTTCATINAFPGFDYVLGSAAQVTAGIATHSTWASVIAAASAGNSIYVLAGAWAEAVVVDKTLTIIGSGHGSVLTGTVAFTSAADYSSLELIKVTDNITFDSGADGCHINKIWLAAGKTFIDNGSGNLLTGIQE